MSNFPRPWIYRLHEDINMWMVTDANKNVLHYFTDSRFDPVVEQIVVAVNGAPADRAAGEVAVPLNDLALLSSALQVVANGGSRSVDVLDDELAARIVSTARKYSPHATFQYSIVRR